MEPASSYFDGNWFDIASVAGGLLYAVANRYRLKPPPAFMSLVTGRDVLNGASLVPLLFLSLSLFSTYALTQLVHFNRVIVSLAGLVALFAVLEEP